MDRRSTDERGNILSARKKELLKSDAEYEVILIDATESPVERPQKNRENTTQARKKDIH